MRPAGHLFSQLRRRQADRRRRSRGAWGFLTGCVACSAGTKGEPGSPGRRPPSRSGESAESPACATPRQASALEHYPRFHRIQPRPQERYPLRSGGWIRDSRVLAVPERPYRFARPAVEGGWLDLSAKIRTTTAWNASTFPRFRNPEELAGWLDIPLGQLAWLVHRFEDDQRPANESAAHYCLPLDQKASGGKPADRSPQTQAQAGSTADSRRRSSITSHRTRPLTVSSPGGRFAPTPSRTSDSACSSNSILKTSTPAFR